MVVDGGLSAAAVLAAFGKGAASGLGSAAAKEVYAWVRENPKRAKKVAREALEIAADMSAHISGPHQVAAIAAQIIYDEYL